MEDASKDETNSVRGLLDSERLAAYLGVPRGTIRSWTKRKADGIPGVHAKFPSPLEEQLGGTALWDEQEVRAFKAIIDEETQRRERKKKDATSTLQPVQSDHE